LKRYDSISDALKTRSAFDQPGSHPINQSPKFAFNFFRKIERGDRRYGEGKRLRSWRQSRSKIRTRVENGRPPWVTGAGGKQEPETWVKALCVAGGSRMPCNSAGVSPQAISAICSRPGGLEFPPPDRRPFSVDAVIAFALFRLLVSGVGHQLAAWSAT
jgi:hypothetical protein